VRSIRTYLLSRLLAGSALVLAVAGAGVYLAVTRALQAQFDDNLSNRVQGFASILFQVEDEVEFEFSDELMPEYEREERPAYFQLRFRDGRPLERSNSLRGRDLAVPLTPDAEPRHWSAALPDGRRGRYVAQLIEVHHVYPEEGPERPDAAEVLVVVARGREELLAAERTVLTRCVLAFLVLMGLIGFLCWSAVHRGLEPAHRLAATLDAIEVDRLPARFDVGQLPRELQPMADKTGALMRRVEAALERERRTTADIAHELRTPISELLTVSEVSLRDGRDPEGARKALGKVRDVAWRMGRTVITLLKLARLEMGAETFDRESVDLGGLVAEALRSLGALERERGLRVVNQVGADEHVEGDREALRIVSSNLLSNALYYCTPHGTVECRLERSRDGWRLVVENDSADLAPEDLRSLSEPFWRKDGARTDRERFGLGLALSRALAERTAMELVFELEDGTFRASLSSPAGSRERASNGRSAARAVQRAP
jgi:signal transduction histidine kinase